MKSAGGVADWKRARNILAVRLDSLGDVLMTTPALAAIKHHLPHARLTLLTSPSGAALGPYLPAADEVIEYQAPWMKATPARGFADDELLIQQLRRMQFDAAVVFTVYSQSPFPAALLCHLAGIPLGLAYSRENPYQLLSDWQPETEPQQGIRHEVQRHLDLVAAVGFSPAETRMHFTPLDHEREAVRSLLAQAGVLSSPRSWVAVHSGATAPSRRYPLEHLAEVLSLLHRQMITCVLTGSADEKPDIERLLQLAGVPALDLSGRLTLGELGALIEAAPLLISNNTGPAHLAAAVGTPVVDLYALTNPQHTPWGVASISLSYDVPCKFCYKSICPEGHHRCLREVQPEWVVEAALALLEGVQLPTAWFAAKGLYLHPAGQALMAEGSVAV